MTEFPKDKKKQWLLILVIILAVLLCLQSMAVIYFLLHHKTGTAQVPAPYGQTTARYGSPAASVAAPHRVSPAHRLKHRVAAQVQSDPFFQDAFDSMGQLQDHLNQMFGRLMTQTSLSDLMGGDASFDFTPTLDVEEKDSFYIVRVDLPGLDKDKIEINVRGDVLTLKGTRDVSTEKSDEKSGVYKRERSYGSFARSVQLPGPVNETGITADYQNGVLTVKLPKTEAAAAKKIAVQ